MTSIPSPPIALGSYSTVTGSERYDFDSRSIASWAAEEDYDRLASRAVLDAFSAIDDVLYADGEGVTRVNATLLKECSEWQGTFVHLRLKGHQVYPSRDEGVQVCTALNSKELDVLVGSFFPLYAYIAHMPVFQWPFIKLVHLCTCALFLQFSQLFYSHTSSAPFFLHRLKPSFPRPF